MDRTLRIPFACFVVFLASSTTVSAAAMVFSARLIDGQISATTRIDATFGESQSPGIWDGSIRLVQNARAGSTGSPVTQLRFSVNGSTPRLRLSACSSPNWILHQRTRRDGVCYDLARIRAVSDEQKLRDHDEPSDTTLQIEGLPVRGLSLVNLVDVSFGLGDAERPRIAAEGSFADPTIVRALPTWQPAITGALAGLFWRWRRQRARSLASSGSLAPGSRRRFIGSSPMLRDRGSILGPRRSHHRQAFASR